MSAASDRVADDLRRAILDHNDPETVRDGAPAWLLMVDALAAGRPHDATAQAHAAQLYAAYAGGFAADDPPRARRLATRAREYGRASLCAQRRDACELASLPFERFDAMLATVRERDLQALYAAALGELVYIQAHADHWGAIAGLPRAQRMLERVVELDDAFERGAPHAFLGVLHSLRPPALGGEPERGRAHFERALELSDGRDLMTQVLFAEYYARVSYDRAMHDGILERVLDADPRAPGYTMSNVLAQRRARELLASAGDYFFED